MFTRASRPLVASALVGVLGAQAATAATLSDDFDGPAGPPNPATWVTSATNGSATWAVDGSSNLVINAGIPNASQRGLVVTQESSFDPFTAPLTIDLDGIAVGGNVGAGVWNSGYVVLGRSTGNATAGYIPNGGTMAYGVSVFIQKIGTAYKLHVNEFSDNDTDSNPSDGTVLYADHLLNGVPTGLTLVVDGANQSLALEVTGTTFTASGTANATQALSTHFTAANLTDNGTLLSRIALGAMNGGSVDTPSTFTVDSINVVPEPAAAGLMVGGLLLAVTRKGRRN